MKIIINGNEIDMALYECYYYHRELNIICFVVRKDIADYGMQIPLLFMDRESAKEAFIRLNTGKRNNAYSVSLSDLRCIWPNEIGSKISRYAAQMLDFDRPLNI